MKTIVFYIPSLGFGGAEKVFINIANYFSNNYKVYIVLHKINNEQIHLLNKNIYVYYIGHKFKFISFIKLIILIRKLKPQAVFSTLNIPNIFNVFARYFSGIKYKVITRQASPIKFSRNSLIKLLLKYSYTKSDIIIANSKYTKESIINELLIKETIKIKTIYNPIYDPHIYSLSNDTSELYRYISKGEKYILCVGRLEKTKNFEMVLRAFQICGFKNHVKLIILGDGSQRANLSSLANELNIANSVVFAGNQTNPYPFYNNASLFISSSIWEGFGNVLVEALCFGLPIIATNCYGAALEILENGKFGELVDLNNYKQMAEAIDKILMKDIKHDVDLIRRAQDFSIEKIFLQYNSLVDM